MSLLSSSSSTTTSTPLSSSSSSATTNIIVPSQGGSTQHSVLDPSQHMEPRPTVNDYPECGVDSIIDTHTNAMMDDLVDLLSGHNAPYIGHMDTSIFEEYCQHIATSPTVDEWAMFCIEALD